MSDDAFNQILGASASATLTNVDNRIAGAGQLGAGKLAIVNGSGGIIAATETNKLVIDTGPNVLVNAGLIEAVGSGGAIVYGTVDNEGVLEAAGGVLTLIGPIGGSGSAVISSGVLSIHSDYSQNVAFKAAAGTLQLFHSQGYAGVISGFSASGGDVLDLRDIAFVSGRTKASFVENGQGTGGVLTVTDGAHTALISLAGNYRDDAPVVASDGQGGVKITEMLAPFHWIAPVSGNFSTASDWTGGAVPGAGDDAILDPIGAAFTVTASGVETVASIQTGANATLAVTAGTFTAADGTGTGVNAGQIDVSGSAVLELAGTVNDAGGIRLSGGLIRLTGDTTLTGGGHVYTSQGSRYAIQCGDGTSLTNADATIVGAGYIGGAGVSLINGVSGVIEATYGAAGGGLFLRGAITNGGLLEADGAYLFSYGPIDNTGEILAGGGGTVRVGGAVSGSGSATIVGGDLTFLSRFDENVGFVGSGGTLTLYQSQSFTATISGLTTSESATLDLGDIQFLSGVTSVGIIENGQHTGGVLTVDDGSHVARLNLMGDLSSAVFSVTSGPAGAEIGHGTAIHWAAAADGSFSAGASWAGGVAPGGADIAALDPVGANFTVTSSTYEAVAGLDLASNATFAVTSSIFAIQEATQASVNAGSIQVNDQGSLEILGSFVNEGRITIASGEVQATLREFVNGAGGTISAARGTVDLECFASPGVNYGVIKADSYGDISIAGNFVNYGSIYCADGGLRFGRPYAGSTTVVNYGTINAKSDNVFSFQLNSATIKNVNGGVILPVLYGSLNGSSIIGGNFAVDVRGVLGIGGYCSMKTATFTNGGIIDMLDASLEVQGLVQNTGQITVESPPGAPFTEASLIIGGTTTLSGGGTITLEYGGGSDIRALHSVALINSNNTIVGSGTVGYDIRLINQAAGVIDAHYGSGFDRLVINTGANTISNAGTLQASGGYMIIGSAVTNSGVILVAGGEIMAEAAVSGAGTAIVASGTLAFLSSFSEAVTFTGSGALVLGQSQSFHASITGFPTNGGGTLDLRDIAFASGTTHASFLDNGHHTGGVLTVTDGVHTARLSLVGDFVGSVFSVSSDGAGGTDVVDPKADSPAAIPSAGAIAAAMAQWPAPPFGAGEAGFGGSLGSSTRAATVLVKPHPS